MLMKGKKIQKEEQINIDAIDANLAEILQEIKKTLQKEIEEVAKAKKEKQLEKTIEKLQEEIKSIQEFIKNQGYDKEIEKIQHEMQDVEAQITTLKPLKGKATLIDFWADWCSPCQSIAPIVHQLRDKYKDTLNVIQIDTETPVGDKLFRVYALPFGVDGIPYLLVFDKNGTLIERLVGADPEKLIQIVENVLNK